MKSTSSLWSLRKFTSNGFAGDLAPHGLIGHSTLSSVGADLFFHPRPERTPSHALGAPF